MCVCVLFFFALSIENLIFAVLLRQVVYSFLLLSNISLGSYYPLDILHSRGHSTIFCPLSAGLFESFLHCFLIPGTGFMVTQGVIRWIVCEWLGCIMLVIAQLFASG